MHHTQGLISPNPENPMMEEMSSFSLLIFAMGVASGRRGLSLPNNMAEEYESIQLVKQEAFVYQIPPRVSTTRAVR